MTGITRVGHMGEPLPTCYLLPPPVGPRWTASATPRCRLSSSRTCPSTRPCLPPGVLLPWPRAAAATAMCTTSTLPRWSGSHRIWSRRSRAWRRLLLRQLLPTRVGAGTVKWQTACSCDSSCSQCRQHAGTGGGGTVMHTHHSMICGCWSYALQPAPAGYEVGAALPGVGNLDSHSPAVV